MIMDGCTCGFTPDGSLELTDHFTEVFAPGDDIGADGQVHLEWGADGRCQCGFTAALPVELDAHFSDVFPVRADRVGRDGTRHAPVSAPAGAAPGS